MVVEMVDPRAEPGTPVEPYELSVPLGEDLTVGLLANGFPDSVAFLDRVGEALAEAVPGLRLARYDKGDASSVASEEMLDSIVAECRAVVAAYGH